MSKVFDKLDKESGAFYKIPKGLDHYINYTSYKIEMSMLFGIISQYFDSSKGYAYPTINKLAFAYGKNERTTRKHLDILEELELIRRFRGPSGNYCYVPHMPLSSEEFYKKYPEAFGNYKERTKKSEAERARSMKKLDDLRARDRYR